MKRLVIAFELIIVFIVIAKIVTIGGLLRHCQWMEQFLVPQPSCAESVEGESPVSSQYYDVFTDCEPRDEKMLHSLMEKMEEIREREERVRSEEERLRAMRNDIIEKTEQLREIETRLTVYLDELNNAEQERYKDLAKVYESSPPEQASAMLEKLDVKTAAAIIMKMKSANAGTIWGYMDSQTAVAITKEITKIRLVDKDDSL